MQWKRTIAIACAAAWAGLGVMPEAGAQEAEAAPKAKNIIFFVADGLGYNHVTAINYYQHGEEGHQPYEPGFLRVAMSTYSEGGSYDVEEAWTDYEYFRRGASDSAATASAMATGVKTLSGRIGVNPDHEPVENFLERGESLGKSTGVVSSVQLSHATPASFVAHNESRGNYEQIGHEMIAESAVDVIMGAGHPYYDNDGKLIATENPDGTWTTEGKYNVVGGIATWEALQKNEAGADANGDGEPDPWTFIDSKEQFQDLATGDTPDRVLGIPRVPESIQISRSGVDDTREDDAPFETPLLETSPTLATMVGGALNVLDNNDKGFVLAVEGGAVDWASHANAMGRMLEEMIGFGDAVQVAIDWVEANSSWDETIIVVTGDHECGYLWGEGSNPEWIPIQNNGQGEVPGYHWGSTSHANHLIPVYVRGAGAEAVVALADEEDKVVGSFLDNAELGQAMFDLLR